MRNWTITKQIRTVTFALMAALALVSLVAIGSIIRLGQIFSDYQTSARVSQLSLDLSEQLFKAEIAELRYRKSNDPADAEAVRKNLAVVRSEEAQLKSFPTVNGAEEAARERLFEDAHTYEKIFGESEKHQSARNENVDRIIELGPKVRLDLNELLAAMRFDNDPVAQVQLYEARQSLMLARLSLERFLLTNDPSEFVEAARYAEETRQFISASMEQVRNPNRARQAEVLLETFGTFWTAAEGAFQSINDRNAAREEVAEISSKLLNDIESISNANVERRGALSEATEGLQKLGLVALIIVALLSIGIGGFLARVIARRIKDDMAGSVAELRAVADGNLDIDISRTDQDTELGDIARALVVFRDNALATEQLRAEQQAQERTQQAKEAEAQERERRAEEERQAKIAEARRRMIQDLRASVGTVVEAGARGDFTQRIEAHFDEVELAEMAKAINTLLDNIEEGVAVTSAVLERLAVGDLSERMQGSFEGAFAKLQSSVNATVDQLAQIVSEIKGAATGLGADSGRMTEQAQELARRAEQQAASLEESSAALEEISATVRSSAEGAERAAGVADEASARADGAGKVMADAVGAMADIQSAAQKISEIVAVIDGIAFQTNLLALNASVEAARAGSAGKGFAVVATEVRALAQRSGEASEDIKRLIEQSSDQIGRGVELVEATGRTLDDIVESVGAMATTMKELITGAREQSTGVQEVTVAISDLDAITQKNSALSDASRDSARSVKEQADALRDIVSVFRLGNEQLGQGAGWKDAEGAAA